MDEINKIWPEWHEDCVVGAGSFGKVYRAKTTVNGMTKYCAVKVVSVPKSKDEIKNARNQGMQNSDIYSYFHSMVQNLLNEITLMENLKDSQNVVGIEDYRVLEHQGDIGWDIYIRMELLTSFDKFIANPNLTTLDILKLGIDISAALIECERKMIVHRDIKPDNIFISERGEFKLGDFGIARKMEASTANMSRKGTLNYMAPEVYKSEEYGSNVDIYSLGLVLYTLLNNNRVALLPPYPLPITYEDNEKALNGRLSGAPLPPPCNADNITAQVILRACEYLPQNRYQTAAEFNNALVYAYNYVLNSNLNRAISVNFQPDAEEEDDDDAMEVYEEPGDPSERRLLRIAAAGVSAAALVIMALLMIKGNGFPVLTGILLAMLPAAVVLSRENSVAAGICCCTAFLPVAVQCGKELTELIRSDSALDFVPVLGCLSALLMIFAGVAGFRKNGVKTLGSLSVYALILYIVRLAVGIAVQGSPLSPVGICIVLCMICTALFGFGYNKDVEREGISGILYFVSFVPAAAGAVLAVISVLSLFR